MTTIMQRFKMISIVQKSCLYDQIHLLHTRSSSRWKRGAARSGWDSRTWGVLGSWNEETSRDWVLWRLDGWWAATPRRRAGGWGWEPSLAITTMFFISGFTCVFRLSVSIRGVASEYLFCVLIHIYSYIFHIYLILFFLVKHIFNI